MAENTRRSSGESLLETFLTQKSIWLKLEVKLFLEYHSSGKQCQEALFTEKASGLAAKIRDAGWVQLGVKDSEVLEHFA